MSHVNIWSDPSKAGASEVAQMAAFLEERSRSPDMREVNEAVCKVLDPRSGERILEVGCGSGVLCRRMAPHTQPDGYVTGVDISPQFITEAQRYALVEGVAKQVVFECARGESLPYPKAAFDGALAARLLLHTDDPSAILGEMARVVRPGGRIVAMDWDFDSVVVDHPDRELTRRLLHWRADHHGGDNWSGRQLWRRMMNAGIRCLTIHPIVTVVHKEEDSLTQSLWRAAQVSRDGGAISADEHDAWVRELKERIQDGSFFASIVYFIVRGIVP
ncbi:MAG TPA: methyltransferase domain-containing protein [Anaerolineales bacterium]|nr:methyltransferase domain-containing protein [Anaerolineales bacterium]